MTIISRVTGLLFYCFLAEVQAAVPSLGGLQVMQTVQYFPRKVIVDSGAALREARAMHDKTRELKALFQFLVAVELVDNFLPYRDECERAIALSTELGEKEALSWFLCKRPVAPPLNF